MAADDSDSWKQTGAAKAAPIFVVLFPFGKGKSVYVLFLSKKKKNINEGVGPIGPAAENCIPAAFPNGVANTEMLSPSIAARELRCGPFPRPRNQRLKGTTSRTASFAEISLSPLSVSMR